MKILRIILCIAMIGFLVLTPKTLIKGAQTSYVDQRFVRDTDRYTGSIMLYHIVRHRPYAGSLTQWLKTRAAAYEKKHKGVVERKGVVLSGKYEAGLTEIRAHGEFHCLRASRKGAGAGSDGAVGILIKAYLREKRGL